MSERIKTFAICLALLCGLWLLAIAAGWAFFSFIAWHLFGPPPMEIVRVGIAVSVVFAICAALGDD